MSTIRYRRLWFCTILAGALLAHGSLQAKESDSYIQQAEQYLAKGDLRSAAIELHNAVRQAPDDPTLHARLGQVLIRLGDFAGAEREARAARDHHGDEASYLPVLSQALLHQRKFDDLLRLIRPGHRDASLESKVHLAIGLAEVGLHQPEKAEADLREAVKLDPKSPGMRVALARFLATRNPGESEKLVDEVLTEAPQAVDALQLKGELLRARGDTDGALRRFDQALKLNPSYLPARLSRANLNIALDRFTAANDDLDPILKAAPNNIEANYLRAFELDKQGKFSEADQVLDRISPAFGEFPAGYFLQGGTKFALGQFAVAESILAKYVALEPNDPKAVRLMAVAALRQQAPARAIGYLKPLIEKGSPDAATLSILGNAYLADRKPDLALEQFQKAAALQPDNPRIQTDVAVSQIGSGEGEKGLSGLEKIFESKSGAPIAGPSLVVYEIRAGHLDKAAAVAAKLVADNPKNALYQTLLGVVAVAQKKLPEAVTAFRAAAQLEPNFAPAAQNLAHVYLAMGKPDDALKTYQQLLAKKPDNVTALLGLADVYVAEQKWGDAITTVNHARAAAPNEPGPGLKLVALYAQQKDWKNANAVAAALAAQFPRNLEVLDMQARAQVASGNQSGAIATYKRAHEISPESLPILSRYLRLLMTAKDYASAENVLKSAIDRAPGNLALKGDMIRIVAQAKGVDAAVAQAKSYAYADPVSNVYDLLSAQLYEKAGRNADAKAVLEKGVSLRPHDDETAIALARLYARMNDPGKATALLEERLKTEPDNLPVTAALGGLYMQQKNYDAAIAEYSRVVGKRAQDAVALNNLAWLYQQKGDLEKARTLAERAVAAAPRAAQIDDTLGWILLAQGETDKAITYLTTASKAAPREPEIQYHLAVALHRAGRSDDAKKTLETLIGSGVSFSDRGEAQKLLAELKRG